MSITSAKAIWNQLQELRQIPIQDLPNSTLSMATGYLMCLFSSYSQLSKHILKIQNLFQNQKITTENLYQLLSVLKNIGFDNFQSRNLNEKLVDLLSDLLQKLTYDKHFLSKTYFSAKMYVQTQSELGECRICLCNIQKNDICLLGCGHLFHKECFQKASYQKISQKAFPLICPNQSCNHQVNQLQLREYISADLLEKYMEFTFQSYIQGNLQTMGWCLTPGCNSVFQNETNCSQFQCLSCNKNYCLSCNNQMHTGLSCADYQKINGLKLDQQAKQFLLIAKASEMKQCPHCKFWIQRNEGCNHMTCRCKYQFCYVCRGKHGKCKCTGNGGKAGKDFFDLDFQVIFESPQAKKERQLLEQKAKKQNQAKLKKKTKQTPKNVAKKQVTKRPTTAVVRKVQESRARPAPVASRPAWNCGNKPKVTKPSTSVKTSNELSKPTKPCRAKPVTRQYQRPGTASRLKNKVAKVDPKIKIPKQVAIIQEEDQLRLISDKNNSFNPQNSLTHQSISNPDDEKPFQAISGLVLIEQHQDKLEQMPTELNESSTDRFNSFSSY